MSPLGVFILFYHLTYTVRSNEVTYVNNRHLLAKHGFPPEGTVNKAGPDESKAKEKDQEITLHVDSKVNEVEHKPPEPQEKPLEPQEKHLEPQKKPLEPQKQPPEPQKEPPEIKKTKSTTEAPINNETKDDHKIFKTTEMESGALLRGVSVVVVLTTIVILYLALKTYCGKKSKHPIMVSKYGVRTRRSDIEMTPLPLDDDEEDETLFEVNNLNR